MHSRIRARHKAKQRGGREGKPGAIGLHAALRINDDSRFPRPDPTFCNPAAAAAAAAAESVSLINSLVAQ